MRKFLLTLVLMTAGVFSASAKSLVLTLKDGTKVYFLITDSSYPMMKIKDGEITLGDEHKYTFPELATFVVSNTDDPNGVEDVEVAQAHTYKSNTLVFAGDANKVKVYNVSGAQVDALISENNGSVAVNLNNLPNGAYVISTGSTSFKVVKKS
ncbi:MAG: T9SS type A sorting domain-containing protein [Bacteroidaceae bacterium]|nr:T9SS type A sorting domain-containing protein [Bacteroidaceae bacterium]